MLLFMARWDGEPVWLAMDRTNWQFGGTDHNLLVVSVQIGNTAIPVAWKALNKAGNSSADERIALMRKVLRFLPKEKIRGLLADREFIGQDWLNWLIAEEIPFVTRLRHNLYAALEDGTSTKVGKLFSLVREGCPSARIRAKLKGNVAVTLQAKRTAKGLVIVACHELQDAAEPVNLYRKRWKIECAFACLKRKGFALEDTHLKHPQRLETLVGVVAIAYVGCVIVGNIQKPPPTKNHGYAANCTFTLGKYTLIAMLNDTEKIINSICYLFNDINLKETVV